MITIAGHEIGREPLHRSSIFPRLRNAARPANSRAAIVHVSVCSIVRMTLRAMRLDGINTGRAKTSQQICSLRNDLKMVWIAARVNAAQMVDDHVRRNWLASEFIHDSVNEPNPAVDSGAPVPMAIAQSVPNPAGLRLCYSRFKAFGNIKNWLAPRNVIRVAMPPLAKVMLLAKSVAEYSAVTAVNGTILYRFSHSFNYSRNCES